MTNAAADIYRAMWLDAAKTYAALNVRVRYGWWEGRSEVGGGHFDHRAQPVRWIWIYESGSTEPLRPNANVSAHTLLLKLCALAHELGHVESYTREPTRFDAIAERHEALAVTGSGAIVLTAADLGILEEERGAWNSARKNLASRGFEAWNTFRDHRAAMLATYEGRFERDGVIVPPDPGWDVETK
jgi:hypothetical protein